MSGPRIPLPPHLHLKRHLPRRRPSHQNKLANPPQDIAQDKIRHWPTPLSKVRHGNRHLHPVQELVRVNKHSRDDGGPASLIAYLVERDADGKGDGAEYVIRGDLTTKVVEFERGGRVADMVRDEILKRGESSIR